MKKHSINITDIANVYKKIANSITKTPLEYSSKLSEISNANVYLKMEHLQKTGSFKLRGMLSKMLSLSKDEFNKTFVAASTGNHAAAFGYVAKKFGFKGVLFLPENVNKSKLNALQDYNLEIIFHGKNSIETEAKATTYAKEINGLLVHPYNDYEIIKGQGTIGLEIKGQLPELDTVIAPIGGGGLVSGLASYFKDTDKVEVIGCQPNNASEMYDSIQKNDIVPASTLHTIADAAAGGIEEDAMTFYICKKYLSNIELISEEQIKEAVAFVIKHHTTLVEPTAALPVAALLNNKKHQGKNVVLVLTGKKINASLLTEILNKYGNNY